MGAATIPEKVRPLVRLLASPVDAEALGAARGLGRVLGAVGLDLDDLALAISTRPRKPSEILTGVAPKRPSYVCTPRQEAANRKIARGCLAANRGRLRRRDVEFLHGVIARPARLSEPQLDWLGDIASKLELKEPA